MTQRRKWNREKLLEEIKTLSTKLKKKPCKRDANHIYSHTRKYFGTWNNAVKEAGFEIKKLQKPKIPNELNPELSYFLGLLVTDGHLVLENVDKRYKVMIFTSYEEERNIILKLIQSLFEYEASVRPKKYGFNKKTNYEIYICSKNLVNYLNEKIGIPAGAKSKIIRVPKILFKTTDLNISSFVRGVIDGDGTISSLSNCVRIASGSPLFLEDIQKLLSKLKIRSGNITKEKRSDTWILHISTVDNLRILCKLLYENAQFFYPRKKATWKTI
jgi:intein/homing endonuclease